MAKVLWQVLGFVQVAHADVVREAVLAHERLAADFAVLVLPKVDQIDVASKAPFSCKTSSRRCDTEACLLYPHNRITLSLDVDLEAIPKNKISCRTHHICGAFSLGGRAKNAN